MYVSLLDIKKAFDGVWQNGLLYKLHDMGLTLRLWRIIYDSFRQFKCCVSIGGYKSEYFNIGQGVHQGGPLSMVIFQIYLDSLLIELQECKFGATMYGMPVSCPTYADDMAMVSFSSVGQQKLLDIAYDYSCRWRYVYSPAKCVVMTFGQRQCDGAPKFYLGSDVLETVNEHPHLGTMLYSSSNGESNLVNDRTSMACKKMWIFQNVASQRVQPNPLTCSKVYWTAAMSKCCYGMELQCLTKCGLNTLDTVHVSIAKRIQGLNENTANIVPLVSLRWPLLSSFIDQKVLTFMWKIMTLPNDMIYKRILLCRLCDIMQSECIGKTGPTARFVETCKKYRCDKVLCEAMMTGINMSNYEWKKVVKANVNEIENNRWQATCIMYQQKLFKMICESVDCGWPWWRVGKLNVSLLRNIKKMWRSLNTKLIKCDGETCKCDVMIDMAHILFDCKDVRKERDELWNTFKMNSMPTVGQDMEDMTSEQKTVYMYTCLNVDVQEEWMSTYKGIVKFVCGMISAWKMENE